MEHYLAQLGAWVTVIQGVIFVFCVLAFRRGIVGAVSSFAAGGRRKPGESTRPPTVEPEIGKAAAGRTS